jgi:ABC-type polysaccharide/polyol phosphate export permease
MVAVEDVVAGAQNWRVWMHMGFQDIQMRYRRSLIGPFWISLSLASMMLALTLVYSQIFHQPLRDYLTYLAPGLLAWTFIQQLVQESCGVITENEGHLKNVPVPITSLAARMVWRNLVVFGHNLITVVILLVIFRVPPGPSALFAIFGVAVYALLGVGLGIVLGPISARYRDLPQVVQNVMQAFFFVTPIFWMPNASIGRTGIIDANPFYHLVELVRAPMLGHPLEPLTYAVVAACLAVVWLLALTTISYSKNRLYFWL